MENTVLDIPWLWDKTLQEIKSKVSEGSFNTYLKNASLVEVNEKDEIKTAVIACKSVFVRTTIEQRFKEDIVEVMEKETGNKWKLEFKIDSQLTMKKSSKAKEAGSLFEGKKMIKDQLVRAQLREDYTFDNYAVGGSNQMAFAAAQAVAKSPGRSYNPLFIYGGVGVGKTHLMQAIGHVILSRGEGQILCCSGEEFTNDLVEAIRFKSTEKVRAKYRKLKLLMVDDVQFIAGKPSIQEEFFHTFNSIQGAGGQVIMTSDRPPAEIAKLEERLRSRFGAGLIVDIGPADFELRTAILLIKAKQRKIDISMETAQLIAGAIEGVRELQGVLIKLETWQELNQTEISSDQVRELLKIAPKSPAESRIVTPAEVINTIGNFYGVGVQQLKGERRTKMIAWPRQVLMFVLRNELKLPLEEVGRLIGGRDHTTVLHATDKVRNELETNQSFKSEFGEIKKRLLYNSG